MLSILPVRPDRRKPRSTTSGATKIHADRSGEPSHAGTSDEHKPAPTRCAVIKG